MTEKCPACGHAKMLHPAGCKALVLNKKGEVKYECGCYLTFYSKR